MRQTNVPRLTIGIEEEFQIVDGEGQLKSHSETLIAAAAPRLGDQIKAEMMQSVIEAGTKICADISEARAEITTLRGTLAALLAPAGLRIASAGTHPFSHWQDQQVTEAERYKILEDELQDVIRELLIFGLHVHVGIPDREARVEVMNEARYFLPHLLAISTSSPFWLARNTGLKSYRQVIWGRFPRTGIPPDFASYDEYENFVELLVKTRSIDNGRKIWWDLRPHPRLGTIEIRICDAQTRLESAAVIVALVQSLAATLAERYDRGGSLPIQPRPLIEENKWRAARSGLEATLVDLERDEERPAREALRALAELALPAARRLGCADELALLDPLLDRGDGASEQRAVYDSSEGSLLAVAKWLAERTNDS